MDEQEPKYIIKLKEHLDDKIDIVYKKIRGEIGELAALVVTTMASKEDISNMIVKEDVKDMVVKNDIEDIRKEMITKEDYIEGQKEILAHIGRYEVKAQTIEETLREDHKPRIIELEKEVFKTS